MKVIVKIFDCSSYSTVLNNEWVSNACKIHNERSLCIFLLKWLFEEKNKIFVLNWY